MNFSTVAKAEDSCKVVLCMFGKLTGTSGGECNSAINDYFSVKVFKDGDFNPGKTATKRLNLLNSCSTADRSDTKSINDKFGRIYGL
ncbi:conjugal transfer protein [Salmonella enterica]|nr:conjugal transfer protein [Salmonella enterica]